MAIALSLSGCVTEGPPEPVSSAIYAPESIVLTAATPVPTKDGAYTPTTDEIWHSHQTVTRLRAQLDDALRVIENERNLPTPTR